MRYVKFEELNVLVEIGLLSDTKSPVVNFYKLLTGLAYEQLVFVTKGKITDLLSELDENFNILEDEDRKDIEYDKMFEMENKGCPIILPTDAVFRDVVKTPGVVVRNGYESKTMYKNDKPITTLGIFFITITDMMEFTRKYGSKGATVLDNLYKRLLALLNSNIGKEEKMVIRHNKASMTNEFMIAFWGDRSKVDKLIDLFNISIKDNELSMGGKNE